MVRIDLADDFVKSESCIDCKQSLRFAAAAAAAAATAAVVNNG